MHKAVGALVLSAGLLFAIPFSAARAATAATRAASVLDSFGINTHIDFQSYGYQNIAQTIADIRYVGAGGITTLRDSPGSDRDLDWWPTVAEGTGAKFDAFIDEGGPGIYQAYLARMQKMAASGGDYLMGLEGGNEEDDSYPTSLGNDQYQAARFQPTVYQAGTALGLPVFNLSFGAGWSRYSGDYGTVGDLSSAATYANAHIYPSQSPDTGGYFDTVKGFATLAARSRPVAITEFGWTTTPRGGAAGWGAVSEATQASYVLEGLLDGWRGGSPHTFYYALYDDGAGAFGLFNAGGAPKPAATALHNFYTLLADSGASARTFAPGSLGYTLRGLPTMQNGQGDHQLLLEKSDGSFWLVVWNEEPLNALSDNADLAVAPVAATLSLPAAMSIAVYDPLKGTDAIATANASSLAISVPAHPLLIRIEANAPAASPAPGTGSASSPAHGTRVVTTDLLNVRANPALAAARVGVARRSALGTVLEGPVEAGGLAWLEVAYDAGVTGWSAQAYLRTAPVSSAAAANENASQLPAATPGAPSLVTPQHQAASSAPAASAAPSPVIPPVDTPAISVPAGILTGGSPVTIAGISVADAFGAVNPGTLAFDVSTNGGTVSLKDASGATVAGSGSTFILYADTLARINQAATTLTYTPAPSSYGDTITITVYNQAGVSSSKTIPVRIAADGQAATIPAPGYPAFSVPAALALAPGGETAITGIRVSDPFAVLNPGTLALRIYAQTGTLSSPFMQGSGTNALSLDAPLTGVNDALSSISYTAPATGSDTILVSVWNQAGLHTDETIPVEVR